MGKPKLLVVCHTNLGHSLSGGDRIFLNLIKYWQKYFEITAIGSQEAEVLLNKFKLKVNFIPTVSSNIINLNTISLFRHHFSRFVSAIRFSLKYRQLLKTSNYIYTASDFYGDFTFGVIAKYFNPKITWLCGYYLLAPWPFSSTSPYNQHLHFFRGLVY
jgi:hypothetical protein